MIAHARRRSISLILLLAWLSSAAPAALAQTPAPAAAVSSLDAGWPRQIDAPNGAVVLLYQPQVDKWEGNRLEARAAVSVRPPGAAEPFFGVIWITARTEVDKAQGVVSLEDIAIPKVNFPSAPRKNPDYLRFARQHVPATVRTVSLVELEANLAATRAQSSTAGVAVNNDPPRIIVSTVPAVLVRIDGQPSLRQAPDSALLRVINTRALVLLDPATGHYYLFAAGRWMQASAVDGPWTPAVNPPAALDAVKQAVAAQVDLLEGAAGAAPPAVYVSTGPAELIELSGAPTWSPIPGTELLYATNTRARVFLELGTQSTYVLISGRWFRARTLDGPWAYVPGAQLPQDFAKIPEESPNGAVLASVPGTPQAQEAVIANSIPQTATVTRSQATFTATYDGVPQWRPVSGTPLVYAANSPTPIIRVDAKTYYSLYNGVWFSAAAPQGPWVVAAVVPAVIYTIPVTSSLHYVTYVRVYGATPTVVYVGYTPGYLGTVVAPDGVVVYGTGVVYTPWVGTVWYPPPPTYGYGAGFAWGATTGFVMGATAGAAVWGCCASSTTTNVNVNKTTYNYNYNNGNVYNSWSKSTVTSGDKSATVYQSPNSKVVTNNQNNNVYASHDGNVYKQQDGQWEKWNGSGNGWQPVNTSTTTTTTTSSSSSKTTQTAPSSTSAPTSQAPGAQQTTGQQRGPQQAGEQQTGAQQASEQRSAQQGSGEQQPGAQQPGAQQRTGQQGAQETGAQQRTQQPGGQQPGAEQRAQQRGAGGASQPGSAQSLGANRGSGGQGSGTQSLRSGAGEGSQRSQGFGQRFAGGGGGDTLGGLDREAMGRERGFQRFSGARAGGLFRR